MCTVLVFEEEKSKSKREINGNCTARHATGSVDIKFALNLASACCGCLLEVGRSSNSCQPKNNSLK